ncbi:hypothetical protein GPJ56_000441 [Histomonas meleagridis]|uniref:uncharacterized protein n=1 Tax=Histomonas meleagridis TaxID=135588 RepID=UPI003559C954|nr:hypothetical protein GPJ56_000441 [Histomonas meleagridis]KAH0796519.1 hypothetical protein GO595_010412 [Histomonas meleagridis]
MKFLSNENEILRCNSYLSQLLKVFQERFYGGYSDVFVKPLLELIRNESPLHIKDPEKFDAQKVRELIHVFVRCVVYSRSTIPPQLCHIAYYLKSSVISSFNTKGSVVHSLAALYGLRFIVPLLISSECDEALKENLLHFVQIIQMLLGLNEINLSKNNHLESLEEIIEESVPVISDFLLSLADIDPGVVKYPKFSDEEVDKAVKTVISAVLPKFDAFHQKYMELYQNEKEKRFINSWVIEHNLLNFFKQNPD